MLLAKDLQYTVSPVAGGCGSGPDAMVEAQREVSDGEVDEGRLRSLLEGSEWYEARSDSGVDPDDPDPDDDDDLELDPDIIIVLRDGSALRWREDPYDEGARLEETETPDLLSNWSGAYRIDESSA